MYVEMYGPIRNLGEEVDGEEERFALPCLVLPCLALSALRLMFMFACFVKLFWHTRIE